MRAGVIVRERRSTSKKRSGGVGEWRSGGVGEWRSGGVEE
jgi:hypothetical protein